MIYVPYTFIHPPTWASLAGREVCPWPVDEDLGYLQLFEMLWDDGADFTIVEHDVVIQRGQLEQFEECLAGWCCFPERGGSPSLSLVRFRRASVAPSRGDCTWTPTSLPMPIASRVCTQSRRV